MSYLDLQRLDAIDTAGFRAQRPYPWTNPEALLTAEGYQRLREGLPGLPLFEEHFGRPRKYGQKGHDRYVLRWREDLACAPAWKEFIAELGEPAYERFLARLLGTRAFSLSFHWHYTPSGCSVSPHCDAKRKLGSHIFYFNAEGEWDPSWGGETVILDDGGRFHSDSAPKFDDFPRAFAARAVGNYSLIFARGRHSWHGVREIHCPESKLRKVFIVEIDHRGAWSRACHYLSGWRAVAR